MPMVDIEVGLSDEEQAIRYTARKFADEVMRPAGTVLDQLVDPAEVIAPGSAARSLARRVTLYNSTSPRRRYPDARPSSST